MRKLALTTAALAGMLLSGPARLEAQLGTVDARVMSVETGEVLSGVRIAFDGTDFGGLTDDDGRALITNVPVGTYSVSAQRFGYETVRRPVQVRTGETLGLEVELSEKAVELGGIVVVGQRREYTIQRTSTAMKIDVPWKDVAQSLVVVTAGQIRDQGSPTVQEALRYSPGVRNELYGLDNRGDWFGLRGSPESTTFLDGMRLPSAGNWGVVRNEPYAFERIDILLGPSSIIAGQNDPGGILNLVSKRPQALKRREVGIRTGNHGRAEFFTDWTGALDQDATLLYRFVALGRNTGTQVRHAEEERIFVAPSVTWRGPRHSVTVFGEYQYDRSGNTNAFLGRAGTLEPAPHGPISDDLFISEPDWDKYGGTRNRLGYEARVTLDSGWDLSHDLRHDRVDGLLKSMYAAWWGGFVDADGTPTANGRYLGRWAYVEDAYSNVTTADLLLHGKAQTGGVGHTIAFGVDGAYNDWNQRSVDVPGTPLDVYDPMYGTSPEPELGNAPYTQNKVTRLGFVAQDRLRFAGGVSLHLGFRRDYIRNEIVDGEKDEDSANSANVGVVWEGPLGLAPYASYSESFSPVGGTDASGASFDPRRASQIEAGIKWESDFAPLQASAAFYSIKDENRLVTDPDDINYSVQLGEARIKGVELEARGAMGHLNLLGSYAYLRVRADAWPWGGEADPDEQMEGFPEHTASAWAVYDLHRLGLFGLSAGGGVRHTGRIGDGTGNSYVPAVTLLDAMASFDTGPWRVALNVNNLTDKEYLATCLQRGDCWFGMRRSVQASVSYRW